MKKLDTTVAIAHIFTVFLVYPVVILNQLSNDYGNDWISVHFVANSKEQAAVLELKKLFILVEKSMVIPNRALPSMNDYRLNFSSFKSINWDLDLKYDCTRSIAT